MAKNNPPGFTDIFPRPCSFTGECKYCGWQLDGAITADSYELAAIKILDAHNLLTDGKCKQPNIAIKTETR